MNFMGIDQSLRSTGLSVISGKSSEPLELSLIVTKDYRGSERLAYIYSEVKQRLKTHKPRLVAIEGYSMESTNRPYDLGELGGILRLLFEQEKKAFVIVPPKTLKKFVTGRGDATKADIRKTIQQVWGLDIPQDDKADAYGLAQFSKLLVKGGSRRCEIEALQSLKTPHMSARCISLLNKR